MRTEKILHSPRPFLENYKVILETKNPVNYGINGLAYNFYVGDNTKRILSSHSLPKFIQLKLAMINSIPKEDWKSFEYDDTFTELDCYIPPKYITYNPEFKNIGWCVSDSIYVIIMSEDELSELKGISIDTRKESQRESQTHTQRT
jgi:hypothetical protein